jgi:hypothetical protein
MTAGKTIVTSKEITFDNTRAHTLQLVQDVF